MWGFKLITESEYQKLLEQCPKVEGYHDIAAKVTQSNIEIDGLLEEKKVLEHRLKQTTIALNEQIEKNEWYRKELNMLDAKQATAIKLYDTLSEFLKKTLGEIK